jgi:homogentisate 1,2-dioxygenase
MLEGYNVITGWHSNYTIYSVLICLTNPNISTFQLYNINNKIMPIYHTLGQIPHKRHTVFRKPDGGLYAEELVSTEGFSSLYSLVYHTYPPTMVKTLGEPYSVEPKIARAKHLKHTSLIGFNIKPADDYLESRKAVLVNNDLHISLAAPRKSMTDYFFKNAQADEVVFIHVGSGTLKPALAI